MLKIGITGGIGSGKSVVCRILESLGYPVFYSDIEANHITNNNPEVRDSLVERYGTEAFIDSKLNRVLLAEKIFTNPQEREFVNSIIHPRVREAFEQFAKNAKGTFVFNEAAILFETDSYKQFNCTILVTAPINTRISRVMKRDNCSTENVQERMKSQWLDEQKIPLADYVIVNDEDNRIIEQVEHILELIGNADSPIVR